MMIKSNWNSLPAEILQQVFQLVPLQRLTEVALVCRTWVRPAQALLFSEVYISCLCRLKDFCDNVKDNTQLGNEVKVLRFNDLLFYSHSDDKKKLFEFITILLDYLTNIEVLPNEAFKSYIPVLNALKESRLGRLRRISAPTDEHSKEEITNYVSSVLLAKDRIENLSVSDDWCLYKKLEQFENLTEIEVRQKTVNTIQVLEHVVETSKSLKKISFSLSQNNNASNTDITTFTPRPHIKALQHCTNDFINEKILFYIMKTFTGLEILVLNFLNGENNLYELDTTTMTRLLFYLSEIKDFSITNFHVTEVDIIPETIGDVWEATSSPENKEVRFTYSKNVSRETVSLYRDKIHITYLAEEEQWEQYDFVEINGKYIHRMQVFYKFDGDYDSTTLFLPYDFMLRTLTCCPNLKYLHLFQCSSNTDADTGLEDMGKVSLDEFIIDNCEMWGRAQRLWSSLLSHIKRVEVGVMDYCSEESVDLAAIGVNMPYTNVDEVVVKVSGFELRYIGLYVASIGCHYYYRLDSYMLFRKSAPLITSSGLVDQSDIGEHIEVITKEEYNERYWYDKIYISCQNKPTLVFENV